MKEYREISGDEAGQLLADRGSPLTRSVDFLRDEYAGEDGDWTVRLYEGKTVFNADFFVHADTVLVDGDLVVQGLLSDCIDVDHTLLVVLGNLTVRDAHLAGEVMVGGDFSAQGLVFADSSNDYQLLVLGNLKARALVEAGMFCEIQGDIHADHVLSLQNEIVVSKAKRRFVERRASSASDLFVPDVLDDGYPDGRAIYEALKAGKPVLR
jgi:molybdopterin converting factor small subunit